MRIDPKIRESLKNIGFTDYFVSIYTCLLKNKELDARRLSEKTNVPYSRVYEVLNEMIEKGVLMKIEGRPSTYVANSPREMLTSLHVRQSKLFEENANKIRPYLESLYGPGKTTVETTLSVIYGMNAAKARLANIVNSTARSLFLAIKDLDSYFLPVHEELARLKVRNAHVSVIVENRDLDKPSYRQIADLFPVKEVQSLIGTLTVSDGMNVLYIHQPAIDAQANLPQEVIGLTCSHSSIAFVLQAVFQYLYGEV